MWSIAGMNTMEMERISSANNVMQNVSDVPGLANTNAKNVSQAHF